MAQPDITPISFSAPVTLLGIQDLYNRTGAYANSNPSTAPNKMFIKNVNITDRFTNIATADNAVGDSVVNDYVVQNLRPNTEYKLVFKMYKMNGGVQEPLVSNGAGDSVLFTPAAVDGVDSSVVTNNDGANPYWWSSTDLGTRELRFKTGAYTAEGSSVNSTGFGGTRQGATYNAPSADSGYTGFTTLAKSYPLQNTGKPAGGFGSATAISDVFDGYLFIFDPETMDSTSVDPNVNYTTSVMNNNIVGYQAGQSSTGFIRVQGINDTTNANGHANGSNVRTIGFTESMFTTISQPFYTRSGAGLDRDKTYKVGLMLVNRTSGYIVRTNRTDGISGNTIRWYVADIPVGGVWSISLGAYREVNTIDTSLSGATSWAVSIDAIGVQGTVDSTADYKMVITAVPIS